MRWLILSLLLVATPVYAGQIRQDSFSDFSGKPTYTYTDDEGRSSRIYQDPFPDLAGNPVVHMEGSAGNATFRQEAFPDLSGHPVTDVDEE